MFIQAPLTKRVLQNTVTRASRTPPDHHGALQAGWHFVTQNGLYPVMEWSMTAKARVFQHPANGTERLKELSDDEEKNGWGIVTLLRCGRVDKERSQHTKHFP
jgi:hypothetical protein